MNWIGFSTVLFTLSIIIISIIILLDNRNPSTTVAWLLILFLLPGLGIFLYLYIGQNHRKKKTFIHKRKEDYRILQHLLYEQAHMIKNSTFIQGTPLWRKHKMIPLLLRSGSAPLTTNNEVQILQDGEETYSEMLEAMEGANHHIHMEYFIIKDSEIGRVFQKMLIKKAKEGLEVRLIYDAVGSFKLKEDFLAPLRESGVECVPFLPVTIPLFGSRLNYRNHRKILVVDGRVGFLGGLNIGDEYLGKNKRMGYWRDIHLKLRGEGVYVLQGIFLMDWFFVRKKELDSIVYFPQQGYCGEKIVQVSSSGPDSNWPSIHQGYFTAITSAVARIYIMTPYLIPDQSILIALKTAALSGVDVRILLPGRPDHRTVFWASKSHFIELLEAGVKIYQYQLGFVHGKVMVVDDSFISIGTANLDIRSFELNFEVNAFIYDKELTLQMRNYFEGDLEKSKEITLETYTKRPFTHQIKESVARLFSPIL